MADASLVTISSFFVVGINYIKSDASIRGQFSINPAQYLNLLADAKSSGLQNVFVLSTCNRTEVYGICEEANELSSLLCRHTAGELNNFINRCYQHQGAAAIEHLFNVAAGLDSQILGDYEIVGQIKIATKTAKKEGCLSSFLERMINEVLQASKFIRSHTKMSSGTVSVSFAAVQYIKSKNLNKELNVLVIGAGKIGANTCKNLSDYLPAAKVTIMNRSADKAAEIALAHNVNTADIAEMDFYLQKAEVVIVATNATEPIVTACNLKTNHSQLFIDLSVPCNVASDVKNRAGKTLINVDELSKINDATLATRAAEIPKVKNIISEHLQSFLQWHHLRQHVPVLRSVKSHLQNMHKCSFLNQLMPEGFNEQQVQKVINGMAVKMQKKNNKGCYYIEALNEYISTAAN